MIQNYERIIVEKMRLAVQQVLSEKMFYHLRNTVEISAYLDQFTRNLVVGMECWVAAGKSHPGPTRSIYYPRDWWQAFRVRWAPKWWLKKWPVQMKTIDVTTSWTHVCPHIDVPADNRRHLEFLTAVEEK